MSFNSFLYVVQTSTPPSSNSNQNGSPQSSSSQTTQEVQNSNHIPDASTATVSTTQQLTTIRRPASSVSSRFTRVAATSSPASRTRTNNVTRIPPECLTATNLTQYWRTEHNGRGIKGGGPHASAVGYACDLHSGLGWFRFTGLAGRFYTTFCIQKIFK